MQGVVHYVEERKLYEVAYKMSVSAMFQSARLRTTYLFTCICKPEKLKFPAEKEGKATGIQAELLIGELLSIQNMLRHGRCCLTLDPCITS